MLYFTIGDRKVKEIEGVSVVGISQIDRVVEVVEETLKGMYAHVCVCD